MGFADFYFYKFQAGKKLISIQPSPNLGLVIAIPAFREENSIQALESIHACFPSKRAVEVIVLLNYPENFREQYEKLHQQLFQSLQKWAENHFTKKLSFFIILRSLDAKNAGVGLARKIAMDEALRRFNIIDNPHGIIASFDADCSCDQNYLVELENHFNQYTNATGCSIYFEHPISGNEFKPEIYQACIQYELYLRCYIEALRHCDFPYAYHTLGSSFAVRADIYARQGGMNKRKAGEDFYFLQKIIQLGNYRELNTTTVIPSPRTSDRVPFGTGDAITKLLNTGNSVYYTFHPDAFELLKHIFKISMDCFKKNSAFIKNILDKQSLAISGFLIKNKFIEKIEEINANCGNLESFRKRYFTWFNGLMVLKFLNELYSGYFNKIPVSEAAKSILRRKDLKCPEEPADLLKILRAMQHEVS